MRDVTNAINFLYAFEKKRRQKGIAFLACCSFPPFRFCAHLIRLMETLLSNFVLIPCWRSHASDVLFKIVSLTKTAASNYGATNSLID